MFHLLGGLNWAVRTEDGSVWLLEADAENQLESLDPVEGQVVQVFFIRDGWGRPGYHVSLLPEMDEEDVRQSTNLYPRPLTVTEVRRVVRVSSIFFPQSLHVDVEGLRVPEVVGPPHLLDQEVASQQRPCEQPRTSPGVELLRWEAPIVSRRPRPRGGRHRSRLALR